MYLLTMDGHLGCQMVIFMVFSSLDLPVSWNHTQTAGVSWFPLRGESCPHLYPQALALPSQSDFQMASTCAAVTPSQPGGAVGHARPLQPSSTSPSPSLSAHFRTGQKGKVQLPNPDLASWV